MSSNKSDAATININLNGLKEASSPNSGVEQQQQQQQSLWPWPWPFPFPFPMPTRPFPFPGGPFGPFLKPGGEGSGMDDDDLYYRGITIGLSMKVQKGMKVTEVHEDLCENVLPRLMKAESMEEIDKSMESAYKAYPKLKEQLHELYQDQGGDGDPGGDIQLNPIAWWIAKTVVRVVVRVAVAAVITALGAKPAK